MVTRMQLVSRWSAAFIVCAIVAGASPRPAVAASLQGQRPCGGAGGSCLSFGPTGAIPVIRAINFAAPSAGTAAVTFHGTLHCAGLSALITGWQRARINLVSEIVKNYSDNPDLKNPGSLRHAASMITGGNTPFDWSTTFNLASTRLFPIKSAGTQRFYFKIARLLQDPPVNCSAYNATFTVLFTP